MNEIDNDQADDRRRFFRIEDEINLFYKVIDKQTMIKNNHGCDGVSGNRTLSAALESISQETQLMLRRLERSAPEIADYLKVLDNKVDLIARALLLQGATELTDQKTRNVNLSASGVAFECEEALNEGEYLDIKMLLASSMVVILTYGKVIHCKKNISNDEYPFLIGIDYLNMAEQDEEMLAKYIIKRQMQQIRDHNNP